MRTSTHAILLGYVVLFVLQAMLDHIVILSQHRRAARPTVGLAGVGQLKPAFLVLAVSLKIVDNIERVAGHDDEEKKDHDYEHHAEPEHDVVDRFHVDVVARGRVGAHTVRVVHGYRDNVHDQIASDRYK
jgi:hypothetical protein